MPLFVNESKVEGKLRIDQFVKDFGHDFKVSSESLLSQEIKEVGPQQLLYIGQREIGGTSPKDDVITVLGSEDATTCHMAVLRHSGSGATSLIHFDGSSTDSGLSSMVSLVTSLTEDSQPGRLELHLIGGFLDNEKNSHDVSNKVLSALCESPHDIHLVTACITHFNTTYKNNVPFPVIYGIAVNVKTGEIYRATFPDKGPVLPLRNARHFAGSKKENIVIYNGSSHELVIPPFGFQNLPNIEAFLSLPNLLIRKYLSTSPDQEPEGFEDGVRKSLQFIHDYPDPLTAVFKGSPLRFQKDIQSGLWVKI